MNKDQSATGYLPIGDYGIIGNLHTVALISRTGSLDFLCFPRFDSPSIFCKILDAEKGGCFHITPVMNDILTKQLYLPDTNVLVTRFFSNDGIAEVIDYMPVFGKQTGHEAVVRKITTVRGKIAYRMECAPRFNYAKGKHELKQDGESFLFIPAAGEQPPLRLLSDQAMKADGLDVHSEFTLKESETAYFILESDNNKGNRSTGSAKYILHTYQSTIRYWQEWVSQTNYKGLWQEVVRRSVLTLKLLICQQFGSIVAAPTFSLPEAIGEERNWDYRYTWIRDAAFSMHAFLQLGFTEEAEAFLRWVKKQSTDDELQLMFAVDGRTDLTEYTLDYLDGYRGSKPVRIGNKAHQQTQMDIYGELLETLYVYTVHGGDLTYDYWHVIEEYIDYVIKNWHCPDHSIWEVRGEKREFLFSRVMCWVAMDRAIKIAERFSFPYDILKWHQVRDEIYKDVYQNFWNEKKQAFVQYKGSDNVDASSLLMPILNIISPFAEKWQKTMEAIDRELRSDVLIYRYREQSDEIDGLKGKEGTFSICSFWHVECLAQAGETEKAKEHFEKMLGYANHLGLFAEEIGMKGEHLGNFPQAFTHLSLISAAIELTKEHKRTPTELMTYNKKMK